MTTISLRIATLLLACVCFTIGCHSSDPASSEAEMQQQITEALEQQVAAWNRWDLDAFLATYHPDFSFASSGNLIHGRDQLEARYRKNYPPERRGVLSFSDIEVVRLDRAAALVLGKYHLDRDNEIASGLFSLVFQHGKEGWQIVHDHSSAEEEEDGAESG